MDVADDLARAREAYERREWSTAYGSLSGADAGSLEPDDFARLATAAYLLGKRTDCVRSFQRAHQGHLAAGETLAAVRCAFWLALVLLTNGEEAVGGGWVARSQRLLEDQPDDVVERGYVLLHEMYRYIFQPDHERAYELALEVTDFGRRFRDPDLLAVGLASQGRMLIYLGHVPEGLALLDEAMVAIATGEVSPIMAGEVYCALIEACQELSDLSRAAEWTTALTTWCDAQPGLAPFTGQCALHRGQLMRARGDYDAALEEFALSLQRFADLDTPGATGLAMSERGDVLRIRGEYDAAEACYAEAAGFGYEPQPGLALLWLARGRTSAAVAAIRRLLEETRDPVPRSRLLAPAVEVLLASGETGEAESASEELTAVATGFGCAPLLAVAARCRGQVRLCGGDPAGALPELRKALAGWQTMAMPYDAARTRVLMARAFQALGDADSAVAELAAARRVFADLGAVPAEHEVVDLLRPSAPGGLTAREVEVLRLVAAGHSNPEIAVALVLSEKTVSRHLSNIFTKLDVSSRTGAAAFAFEHHLV